MIDLGLKDGRRKQMRLSLASATHGRVCCQTGPAWCQTHRLCCYYCDCGHEDVAEKKIPQTLTTALHFLKMGLLLRRVTWICGVKTQKRVCLCSCDFPSHWRVRKGPCLDVPRRQSALVRRISAHGSIKADIVAYFSSSRCPIEKHLMACKLFLCAFSGVLVNKDLNTPQLSL